MKKEYLHIHPELQQLARMAPKITYSHKNLWLINAVMRLIPAPKTPDDLQIENIFIPRADDQTKIRLRVYRPKSASGATPALLWLHGGGYVLGNPEQDDVPCAQYVRELGITVVSVEYRLAPKHPFPAGLEDCYSALKWMASHADMDEKRIAVGGASAGGGLAASLIQLAHDRQEVKPAFQLLVYPMLDDRTVLRSDIDDSSNIAWNQKSNLFGWESYLGRKCGDEALPEYSVPARRKSLSGLPPAWVGVGTVDMFHDEDMAYAQRLQADGVECEVYTVPGAFHGFDAFDHQIPVVQDFRKSQISALRKCFSL